MKILIYFYTNEMNLIEWKDVISDTIVGQIGIFDAAVSNGLLGTFQFFWGQDFIPLFFNQFLLGSSESFVQQIDQANSFTRTGFKLFTVLTQNHTESCTDQSIN